MITILLAVMSRPRTSERIPPEFRAHAWKFLPIWCLAVSADWLQGPYVYELYKTYGYSPDDIGRIVFAMRVVLVKPLPGGGENIKMGK